MVSNILFSDTHIIEIVRYSEHSLINTVKSFKLLIETLFDLLHIFSIQFNANSISS